MAISYGEGDLIAAIYDAIIDPSRWDEVVKRIVEATKSFSGNLLLHQADAGSFAAMYNTDPVCAEASETRVLAEIIGGDGLLAAATKLKITEATARTHANRILAKTGTARQTELIRRFFETALPASPASA